MPEEIDITIGGYPAYCLCCKEQKEDYVTIDSETSPTGSIYICTECVEMMAKAVKDSTNA